MQEIIYKIDNWTITKIIGGFVGVLTILGTIFSKWLLTKLTQAGQHNYDKRLEDLRGQINRNNGILSSIIQNYFSSSQKLLDKKIEVYDLLWSSILKIRDELPSGISLLYQISSDDELNKSTAFNYFNDNPKLGPQLKTYKIEKDVMPIVENERTLVPYRPFLSDNSYKLYSTYYSLIGRMTFQFIQNYSNSKIYNWKKDDHLIGILAVTLTEKEIEHIKSLKVGAFTVLTELLEYKILQDIKNNLSMGETSESTIEHIRDIEKMLNAMTK